MAYNALRTCMKNKDINADHTQKPRYVQPKENYEGKELKWTFTS